MAESFLQEVLKVSPDALQELKAQCTRQGVEDYPEVEALLDDRSLLIGLHRDWRKAIFRLLDSIFACSGPPTPQADDRLDTKVLPFSTYYFPPLLSGLSEGKLSVADGDIDYGKEQAKLMLEKTLGDVSDRVNWSQIDVLTRCLSTYTNLEWTCPKVAALLTGTQCEPLAKFAECLTLADRYDMFRMVYESLGQHDLWTDIKRLSVENRGSILDLWQYTIDSRVGEYGKLRRAIIKVTRETCSLPNSMTLHDVRLKSNDVVGGGGCADIYMGNFEDIFVALKVLRIFNEEETKAVLRDLYKEAIVWRQLKHKNVAPFLGFCNNLFPNRAALVMPWMSNGDLSSYLRSNPDVDRAPFAVQIASGLSYLHSQDPQVIHGDLRANNVLVDDERTARITDFGISEVNVVQTKLSTQNNRGSVRWQAPELHYKKEGLSRVTTKSDVYAYGMTCLEIFTDKVPFTHLWLDVLVILAIQNHSKPDRPTDPIVQRRGLTDRVWRLLEDCWEYDAQSRPSMAKVFEIVLHESHIIAEDQQQKSKFAGEREDTQSHGPNDLRNLLYSLKDLDLTARIQYDRNGLRSSRGYSDIFIGYYIEEAANEATATKLAVERLRRHIGRDIRFSKHLAKEMQIWSRLNHSNILPLVGYALEGDYPCLVSEWMDNGTVLNYLKGCSAYDVLSMLLGVAEGLECLHRNNIVHSVLKAENVLVSSSGRPLICGFATSQTLNSFSTYVETSSFAATRGTVRWMATELLDLHGPLPEFTTKSDVWAFGMTVYELLTRRLPYFHIRHEIRVALAIVNGNLPSRPASFEDPSQRYRMDKAVSKLRRLFRMATEEYQSDGEESQLSHVWSGISDTQFVDENSTSADQ